MVVLIYNGWVYLCVCVWEGKNSNNKNTHTHQPNTQTPTHTYTYTYIYIYRGTKGGLVVVGSYVPKSSEQLQRLREAGGIEVGFDLGYMVKY